MAGGGIQKLVRGIDLQEGVAGGDFLYKKIKKILK